jgi:DNA-binding response OmpR family regulator
VTSLRPQPPSSGGRRVLLADSDHEVQQTVKLVAASYGHDILLATTGQEAFAQAVAAEPDLIILDTLYPDTDGSDLLARLKADSRTAHIPVVVWSGGREECRSERRIALERGAEDYMDMVNVRLLLARLERLFVRLSRGV